MGRTATCVMDGKSSSTILPIIGLSNVKNTNAEKGPVLTTILKRKEELFSLKLSTNASNMYQKTELFKEFSK